MVNFTSFVLSSSLTRNDCYHFSVNIKLLIKLNEECSGAVAIAGIVLVDLGATQRTSVVLAVQPAQQAQLAENMIAFVEDDRVLVVVMAYRAGAAGSLDLLLGGCCAE